MPEVWRRLLRTSLGLRRLFAFSAAILLGFASALLLVLPAAAQAAQPVGPQGGLVLDARPSGEAGLQRDMATISPQPPHRSPTLLAEQAYVVRAGDTLGAIAANLNVAAAALAALNGITDPDQLLAGQTLRIPGRQVPSPVLPADGPLARIQFWPWPPKQGQTLVVWLRPAAPVRPASGAPLTSSVQLSVTFDGQAYPVAPGGAGGWVLLPVPSLAEPGARRLVVASGARSVTLSVPVEAGSFETSQVPAATSDPILSQPAKVRAETERLARVFAGVSASSWTPQVRFRAPLEGEHRHSSPYGSRRTYGASTSVSVHEGEDLVADAGTPVSAPAAGVVVLAEPLFVRGNAVILDHGHGVFTGYWHLERIDVAAGDRVEPGRQLGAVGSTGLSTGPHLHWEMRVAGVAVDPLQWLAP